ncbi:hypothetical protein V8C34DRAFT_280779 [Trichoderma compactum]
MRSSLEPSSMITTTHGSTGVIFFPGHASPCCVFARMPETAPAQECAPCRPVSMTRRRPFLSEFLMLVPVTFCYCEHGTGQRSRANRSILGCGTCFSQSSRINIPFSRKLAFCASPLPALTNLLVKAELTGAPIMETIQVHRAPSCAARRPHPSPGEAGANQQTQTIRPTVAEESIVLHWRRLRTMCLRIHVQRKVAGSGILTDTPTSYPV